MQIRRLVTISKGTSLIKTGKYNKNVKSRKLKMIFKEIHQQWNIFIFVSNNNNLLAEVWALVLILVYTTKKLHQCNFSNINQTSSILYFFLISKLKHFYSRKYIYSTYPRKYQHIQKRLSSFFGCHQETAQFPRQQRSIWLNLT